MTEIKPGTIYLNGVAATDAELKGLKWSNVTSVKFEWVGTPPEPGPPINHPLVMSHWWIEPGDEEELARSKPWKLHRKGWQGRAVDMYSAFEARKIKAFLDALPQGNVHRCRPYRDERSDERPNDIGAFPNLGQSFYLADPTEYDAFVAMLNGLPKRVMHIPIRSPIDRKFHSTLRGYNHFVAKGENGTLLSVEELPNNVLMFIMLNYG
ncbi:MAG: hypothetical protein EOP83_11355 [Verrucomicrobiaceae bacterium]|nr:MAG: hypothetical protein EOP83_11355 [Verrucomicrobiaceae bacterium]